MSKNNRLLLIFSIGIIGIYYLCFFAKDGYIHAENILGIPNYLLKPGENFFAELISKPFDLSNYELNMYRPRWLAFVIQYIDYNAFAFLYRLFPGWGYHLPMVVLAAPLQVFSVYYFLGSFRVKPDIGLRLLVGATSLMLPNFLTTTFWLYRTPKLIVGSIILLFLSLFFRLKDASLSRKPMGIFWLLLQSTALFVVLTLDEALIACALSIMAAAFVFGYLIPECGKKRMISFPFCLFGVSLLFYVVYQASWGRALFEYFTTGGLKEHWHQWSQVFSKFEPGRIIIALAEYLHAAANFFNGSYLMLACAGAFLVFCFIRSPAKDKLRDILLALWLVFSGYLILLALGTVHNPVIDYRDLWDSMYLLAPMACMFAAAAYVLLHRKGPCFGKHSHRQTDKSRLCCAVLCCMIALTSLIDVPFYRVRHMQPWGYAGGIAQMTVNEQGEIVMESVTPEEFMTERWDMSVEEINEMLV